MAGRIARINGTMLRPGVSRNRRLYTKDLIARTVSRMQERISDPEGLPIVMRSHHDAGDDSVRIVGRITAVKVADDGAARYTADLYDTTHGRDIAALVVPEKGQPPALKSVSIHGYWIGPVRTVEHDGQQVTTGDDLEIDAVDFTATPGVVGATVDAATWVRPNAAGESLSGRTAISESAEATVEAVTEHDDGASEAYTAKQKRAMLAKGQAMANANGDPAYPIKNKADLRRAIRAVGRGGVDRDAIRKHIIQRAAALGLSRMIPDTWNEDGSMKETTTATRFSDVREYYDGPGNAAGFCIDAYNGPTSITIRNCSLDPAELRVVAAAAMDAVVSALQSIDPDMDGDVDVDGAPHADTDDDMIGSEKAKSAPDDDQMETAAPDAVPVAEQAQPAPVIASPAAVMEALTQSTPAIPGGVSINTQEVPAVSEPITPAAETATPAPAAPVIQLTQEQFTQLLAAVTPARETAPAAPATESAPAPADDDKAARRAAKESRKAAKRALAESVAAERDALKQQIRDELREEILKEKGLPARQGFRAQESTSGDPSDEDLFERRAEILLGSFAVTPAPAQ